MKNYLLTLNTIDENCKTFSSEATNAAAMHQKRPKLLLLLVYSARGDGCTTSLTVGKKVLPPLQLYPNLLSTSALFSLRKGHNYLSSVKNQRRGFTGALPIFFFFSVYLKRYESSYDTYFEIVKAMAFQSPCVLNSIVNYLLTIVSL